MSKFIKLHLFNGNEILINADKIIAITKKDDDAKEVNATVSCGLCASVDTRETLEEIEEMLKGEK